MTLSERRADSLFWLILPRPEQRRRDCLLLPPGAMSRPAKSRKGRQRNGPGDPVPRPSAVCSSIRHRPRCSNRPGPLPPERRSQGARSKRNALSVILVLRNGNRTREPLGPPSPLQPYQPRREGRGAVRRVRPGEHRLRGGGVRSGPPFESASNRYDGMQEREP
jgi:hypothetical protein